MFVRLLLTLAMSAALALAQRGGGGGDIGDMGGMPGRGGNQGMGGSGMRVQRKSRFDEIADKLKLNKEQKEQAQSILDAAREEAAPLAGPLSKARLGIADALINSRSDEEVKKAQDAYSAVVAQMTGVEAKAFQKIFALLKPNQRSKATQAWDLMADMFTAGGRGGGGRGRGRGPGGDRE